VTLCHVCLSVAYIGPKSRKGRGRKTKIGTEVGHITRDSDTPFKVKKVKGQLAGAGRGILWRPPAQLVQFTVWKHSLHGYKCTSKIHDKKCRGTSHQAKFWRGT